MAENDCNDCATIGVLVSNYDKLYQLHALALKAIIIIAFGRELISACEKFIIK